jgi:hypothetical protein
MKTVRMEVMKNPTQIRLYDIFRRDLHMPDDRAQNLVSTINEALNDRRDEDREELATKALLKDEILATKALLKDEILATKAFVKDEIAATKSLLKDEIQSVKDQMREQMRDLEVRMTRQIYFAGLIQFLGIIGAILAIYAFLRK